MHSAGKFNKMSERGNSVGFHLVSENLKILNKKENEKIKNINENNNSSDKKSDSKENSENNISTNLLSNISNTNSINNDDSGKKSNIDSLNIGNLLSSPEKLIDIQQKCIIPSFEDKDYEYNISLGEGSYGTIYLVSEIETKEEYALKKII